MSDLQGCRSRRRLAPSEKYEVLAQSPAAGSTTASDDQTITVWDVSNPNPPHQLSPHLTGHTDQVRAGRDDTKQSH